MSVFSEEQVTPATQSEQETSFEGATTPSLVGDLVGEGRKFNDVEALAKGKLEADKFIEQMKQENAALKADLEKTAYRLGVNDHLKEMASDSTSELSGSNNNNGGTSNQANTQSTSSEANIESLVEQTLMKREQQSVTKNNIAIVEAELEKTYGTEAAATVQQKAAELGLSLSELQGMASKSPTAFMQLLGQPAPRRSPVIQGSIRTEGSTMQASSEKDFGYYQNLRRENSSLYYKPSTQRAMMADADRLGGSFYK
jgi:hypothetical protein|tara:strand:+ start:381 stop:1148 length:768 start_codon:yes stop_codon:yes gene_type:complete